MRNLTFLILVIGIASAITVMRLYNDLVYKRNRVRSAFSSIDVDLRKRHDLIPSLIDAVKGFAAHEQETFADLVEARRRIESGELSESQRLRMEERIGPGMQRLIAVAEAYPELRSSEHFLNLQSKLAEVEEQISASRRAYNAAVLDINNAVESFPSNLIAKSFGFRRHDFFEVTDGVREPLKADA
ncbi:MAG: LemA family protein [Verrucomicrobiales bacterium]